MTGKIVVQDGGPCQCLLQSTKRCLIHIITPKVPALYVLERPKQKQVSRKISSVLTGCAVLTQLYSCWCVGANRTTVFRQKSFSGLVYSDYNSTVTPWCDTTWKKPKAAKFQMNGLSSRPWSIFHLFCKVFYLDLAEAYPDQIFSVLKQLLLFTSGLDLSCFLWTLHLATYSE